MKIIYILFTSFFITACSVAPETETTTHSEIKTELAVDKQAPPTPSADYSSLLVDYECDMNKNEIAERLGIPVADLELESLPGSKKCNYRYLRNGTYESNLNWGAVPSSKEANEKIITKALKDKQDNSAALGNDIVLAATGDCYLKFIPIHGRIHILSENHEGSFQIFYGSKARRTQEQQDEWKAKMTDFANDLLAKHRR